MSAAIDERSESALRASPKGEPVMEEPEIRISKPLPVDRESKRGPSLVLSVIFTLGMAAIVVPLTGFVIAVSLQWQGGLTFFTGMMKWAFIAIGAVLAYGMLVGLYHTFLAVTGLDRGSRRD